MKPKLTTNWSSSVIPTTFRPGVSTFCSTAMMIGIIAEASAVALAKPRWMTIRKAPIAARIASGDRCARPNQATATPASHDAACVCSSAVPRLMPTPNSTIVPHGICGFARFQSITPMPGSSRSAIAITVVVELSNLCSTPSVDQTASSVSETASSRFSPPVIGPIASSDFSTASCPPGTSLLSGGSIHIMMK